MKLQPTGTSPLGDKLSTLLRGAVRDARAWAKEPGHELNMGVWYSAPRGSGTCLACRAGARMIKTLPLDPAKSHIPYNDPINETDSERLIVINRMRDGSFVDAFDVLYKCEQRSLSARRKLALYRASDAVLRSYREDRDGGRASWAAYVEAARILEGVGL